MLFPGTPGGGARTALDLTAAEDGWPVVSWLGHTDESGDTGPDRPGRTHAGPGMPLLGEHSRGLFSRAHLRGRRARGGGAGARCSGCSTSRSTRSAW